MKTEINIASRSAQEHRPHQAPSVEVLSRLVLSREPVIEGEVLERVSLSAHDISRMGDARIAFEELAKILLTMVVPTLGGYDHPLAGDIERHIEAVRLRSGNFLHRHRHIGASHDAVEVGGVQ